MGRDIQDENKMKVILSDADLYNKFSLLVVSSYLALSTKLQIRGDDANQESLN